jgi:glycosyltransferase involved in cell wall biosynthesis
MFPEIWIWQTEYSPHIASLAAELKQLGLNVRVIVERPVSNERRQLGWPEPSRDSEAFTLIANEGSALTLLNQSGQTTVHLLQGIRGNGYISSVMKAIFRTRRRCLILMEIVDDRGLRGGLKRAYYASSFMRSGRKIGAVLAIGKNSDKWVIARGLSEKKVFEFAYFLAGSRYIPPKATGEDDRFRFIYVGQLISRKRVDLLIEALSRIDKERVSLSIVGDGPLKEHLMLQAAKSIGSDVRWLGAVPIEQAQREIGQADCLVLPSDFDGWGAVVSEALALGTKVICSDHCGAATLVEASLHGCIFQSGDVSDLAKALIRVLDQGASGLDRRQSVQTWAKQISAASGAHYLYRIMKHLYFDHTRPVAPWRAS